MTSESSNNVIQFPVNEKIDNDIFSVVEVAMTDLLVHLDSLGVVLYEKKDVGLMAESIVSAIKRSKGISHPLQEFADKFILTVD